MSNVEKIADVTEVNQLISLGKEKGFLTYEEVNDVLRAASEGDLKGILAYNEEPLVSVDFNHNPASSTYDSTLTKVIEGTCVKVISWYDNEWGFSNRMLDTTVALVNA